MAAPTIPFSRISTDPNRTQFFFNECVGAHTARSGSRSEIDIPAVVRRMDRPLGQVLSFGELEEGSLPSHLGEDFGPSGSVRHKEQEPHSVVIGGEVIKRVVMNRRKVGDLPNPGPGRGIVESF